MSRWIAAFCVVVLVGAGVSILQIPGTVGNSWLTILWAVWIIAVVWVLTRPSFSVLFAAIMAAMLLFVIIPATAAQLYGFTTIAGHDYSAGVVPALKIAALAQCAMLAGAVAARTFWPVPGVTKLLPQLSPSRLDKAARWSASVGVLAVIASSVLGGASLREFFVYTTAGGYGTFSRETTGYLGYLVAIQGAAGLAVVLISLRLGCSGSSRWQAFFLVALAVLVLVGDGQRGRFFVVALAAGLIWLKTSKRRLPPRRLVVAAMLMLIVVGGLLGVGREAVGSRQLTLGSVIQASVGGNDLFLPLAGLANTVPDQVPYLHGTSYVETLAFLVPRGLWTGKPEGAIANITAVMDPGDSGLAFPEFGEMYANFGLAGVIIGSLLFGALIELLSRRFARSTSIQESVFTAVCGAVLLDLFTRGAIAPLFASFAGLLVATALVCRRRSAVLAPVPAPVPSGSLGLRRTQGSVITP